MLHIHRGTLNTESLDSSCRINPKTWDHAENTLFQWGSPNFLIITGDKVLL